MTRGVKVRLIAFVVLAAVGIVYVAGAYLGLVDRVLGRGWTMHVTLPSSGGLFVGSEVTYRGVKVGKVADMHVTREGLRADLALEDGVRIPLDSKVYVHNLSAVGEQYLDFEPDGRLGPYAGDGDTIAGGPESLPVDEGDLLVDLDEFVSSVDRDNLRTVVTELGTTFRGTGRPMARMLDHGDRFLQAAIEHQDATYRLLDNGRVVLETQHRNSRAIRSFSRDLALLTGTLAETDPEVRDLLEGGGATAREVTALMKGLEPTLPVFLGNLVTLNQITTARLPGIEQLLVTFPRMVSSGFTGTPGDGYGHINLQFAQEPGPCRKGYLPSSRWRPASDLTDAPVFPAKCLEGAPVNMRGTKYAPAANDGHRSRVAPYDPSTGRVALADGSGATDFLLGAQGGLHPVFADDSWRWLLTGPMGGTS